VHRHSPLLACEHGRQFPLDDPAHLFPVAGVTLGWVEANIRKPNRKDVLVIQIEEGATVGGVFTQKPFLRGARHGVCASIGRSACGRQGNPCAGSEYGQRECGNASPAWCTRETCEAWRAAGLQATQILRFHGRDSRAVLLIFESGIACRAANQKPLTGTTPRKPS